MMSHPIWDELDKFVTRLDTEALLKGYLADFDLIICGYSVGSKSYEEIRFVSFLEPELISIALHTTIDDSRFPTIRFTYQLKGDLSSLDISNHDVDEIFCKFIIIVNEHLEFVDEIWDIDVDSPFVVAKG